MDAGEFERMYARHAPAIAAFALRRTPSEQDAEEVVAETFLIAWRRGGELGEDVAAPVDTAIEPATCAGRGSKTFPIRRNRDRGQARKRNRAKITGRAERGT